MTLPCNRTQGFTLLELLVALAIFALVATMAYSSLNTVLQAHAQTRMQMAQLTRLQQTFSTIERDIQQQVKRQTRNEYGDTEESTQGTAQRFEFVRMGWRNPTQLPRSQLQRVVYLFEDNILSRHYWQMLDRAQDAKPIKINLLTDIAVLKWRYLDTQGRWRDEWQSNAQFSPLAEMPTPASSLRLHAVELTLTLKNGNTFTRLWQWEN